MKPSALRVADVLARLAVTVWLGGLVVLGAIVAPTVFHNVPLPKSADAMTLVFQRFDTIAMVAAVIASAAVLLRMRSWRTETMLARIACIALLVAAGLEVAAGFGITPAIARLHAQGAVRGEGPLGAALGDLHRWAERGAKAQVLLLLVWTALGHTASARRAASSDVIDTST